MREIKEKRKNSYREREPNVRILERKKSLWGSFQNDTNLTTKEDREPARASRKREGPLHPGRFSPLLVFSSFLFETKTVSRCVNLGFSRGTAELQGRIREPKAEEREREKKIHRWNVSVKVATPERQRNSGTSSSSSSKMRR